jgi:hypothetical protein
VDDLQIWLHSWVACAQVLSTMLTYIVDHMEEIARVCSRDSGKPSESRPGPFEEVLN